MRQVSAKHLGHWLTISNDSLTVGIDKDLRLNIYQGPGDPIWRTSKTSQPALTKILIGNTDQKEQCLTVSLGAAVDRSVEDFNDGTHEGYRIRLTAIPGTDAVTSLILALSNDNELLVQVEQVGGQDTVQQVANLYDWSIKPQHDAYMIVPHGSGYLIHSESPKRVWTGGFVGGPFTLPIFGIVRGDKTLFQIVETWWDALVTVTHTPGEGTSLSTDWESSLDELGYARRLLLRFADKLDHVGIAKAYRRYLIERNKLTTLAERARTTPALKKFLAGMEYRATGEPVEHLLTNIREFQKAGLPVTFLFPGVPHRAAASWQLHLVDQVPGYVGGTNGWEEMIQLADAVRKLGCSIEFYTYPRKYFEDLPAFDPAKASRHWGISSRHSLWLLKRTLANLEQKGLAFDAVYFDGYSAFPGGVDDEDVQGPISRRENYEAQVACFREVRRRGMVPVGEMPRFWCAAAECDAFFFSDWSSDRLRDGEPIPLLQLVFHDCYAAHFSGGGWKNDARYDWYLDRNPRLYELMYGAHPSHNYLPWGRRFIEPEDWETGKLDLRMRWLKRWHIYFQKICYSEMTNHQFLNQDRTLQRIEFANGVVADFDLAKGLFRVKEIDGFTGEWEQPEQFPRHPDSLETTWDTP